MPVEPMAEALSVARPADLWRAAEVLARGGIVALPFNGIWALFGDVRRPAAHARLLAAKGRAASERLAVVCLPEDAARCAVVRGPRALRGLWRDLHGLGVILPARRALDTHVSRLQPSDGTVLLVWTEYPPLRTTLEHFRRLGGRALFGTSANVAGERPLTTVGEVWSTFFTRIDAIVADDYTALPARRRQSTTIVDLTGAQPVLRRRGSVTPAELGAALQHHGWPALHMPTLRRKSAA